MYVFIDRDLYINVTINKNFLPTFPNITKEEAHNLLVYNFLHTDDHCEDRTYDTVLFEFEDSMYNLIIYFAFFFLLIQIEEYSELMFTMADGVYCSLFFLLTGFHGMHVIIGTLFISITHVGDIYEHFTSNRHLGVGFSLIY
jgi:hypothetical protein